MYVFTKTFLHLLKYVCIDLNLMVRLIMEGICKPIRNKGDMYVMYYNRSKREKYCISN